MDHENLDIQCEPHTPLPPLCFFSTLDSEVNGRHAWEQSLPEEQEVMLSQGCYTNEDCENKCHSHFHDTVGQSDDQHHHHHNYHHILHHHHSQNHHPHTHTHRHTHSYSVQHFKNAGVATLAWMVIMGDGLHNFSDGLAIGKSHTQDTFLKISSHWAKLTEKVARSNSSKFLLFSQLLINLNAF